MDPLREAFCRNNNGSWTCVRRTTLQTPAGRIQVTPGSTFYPGTMFMNFDVALWLERRLDDEVDRCP